MEAQTPTASRRALERVYPTPDAVATIYDNQDLNRAVEAYRFFYPTVSMEGIFNGCRELGIEDGKQLMIVAACPHHVGFTGNSDTPYAVGVLDLGTSGPVAVELPPGPYVGVFNDHHQRWIIDLGMPGADAGKGGKYLVVPPGFTQTIQPGFHAARAETFKILLALRAVPTEGDVAGALDALRRVKVYGVATPSEVLPFVDATKRPFDGTPLRWEDGLEYWRRLAGIIDQEPTIDEFRPMYGELAALGIERGQPFAPTPRMTPILEQAARQALDQMRVQAFASQRPDRIVWKGRHWEWVGLVPDNGDFETSAFLDLEARDRWFFQAVIASPAMFRRKVGVGSIYFLAAREGTGAYLDGSKSYVLKVPQPVPAKLFWSVTAYDAGTRSQVQSAQDKAALRSPFDRLEPDADGSIELYFGPEVPTGRQGQWIQTNPETGFFLYFRIYGPEAASLDGTWQLGDVTPVDLRTRTPMRARKAPLAGDVASISTPDDVETRIGQLHFEDGVPTPETAASVYDELDRLHGIETFLNALPAVSLQAIRRGMVKAGARDNDVLLFSGLMDSKSLFLTANCDTIYFFTFVNLMRGPLVFEAPPRVLGVMNDMWCRWVTDVGLAGPDRGEGGRYLLVPQGYRGPLPEGGYYVARARTSRVFVLGRAFLQKNDPQPAVQRIKERLKIYPYAAGGTGSSVALFLEGRGPFNRITPPGSPRFVEGTGVEMNTIVPNDRSFFELLDEAVQQESPDAMDPEIAGQFGALGFIKGRPFRTDARLQKILEEAMAMANAAARTLSFRPRDAEDFAYYGADSAWINILFLGGFDFLHPPPLVTKDGVESLPSRGGYALHARTTMFYLAFGITPAMCMRMTGIGSQYLGCMVDAHGEPFDGARAYTLKLPPNIPAAAFWSITVYDNQTRSMLQTPQRFPRAGSQSFPSPAARQSADGSTKLTFCPQRPDDMDEGNWIQTAPGKGWFAILRLYSPLAPFFDKSWRPGEIEPAPG